MKKIILLLLILVLLATPVFADNDFSDIDDSGWYSNWVGIIKQLKITSGYPNGTFRPSNQLKRIELLSFTMKSLGHDIPVADGYWGTNIINKAIEENIIQLDDLMFTEPNGFITREETARVIYNAYLKENPVFTAEVDEQVRSLIIDIEDVNDKYLEGVIGVFATGIVEGYDDKSFKPKNNLTRAEASVFITRLALTEKRKKVSLDLSKFVFKSDSTRLNDHTEYYSSEHQDIYNILEIANAVENEDVEHGFAAISSLEPTSGHSIWLYSNLYDHDNVPGIYMPNYKRWQIEVRKLPPDPSHPKEEWIEIWNWRDKNSLEHEEVMKAIFDYLFAEDADLVWNKFFEASCDSNYLKKTIDYEMKSNGRILKFYSSSNAMVLRLSRKVYAEPVNVEDYR